MLYLQNVYDSCKSVQVRDIREETKSRVRVMHLKTVEGTRFPKKESLQKLDEMEEE